MSSNQVQRIDINNIDQTFGSTTIDLITKPLGSRIIGCSDEWFADASNLTTPTPPVRKAGVYVHTGAWFDGWETRRHNAQPFDWVIIRLGVASGKVKGIEIDTAFFNGNEAPAIGVDGLYNPNISDEDVLKTASLQRGDTSSPWESFIIEEPCGPSQRHAWSLSGPVTEKPYTHVRLLMFPDGGIARFRLYGISIPVFPTNADEIFDLAAAAMGGRAISCSDQHFGRKENLLLPGRGKDMGDGWETARSRTPGHVDWTIIQLGAPGIVENFIIDTAHFRGNYPQAVSVMALNWGKEGQPGSSDSAWIELIPRKPCQADQEHTFGVAHSVVSTHIKLIMIPDGGIKRIRAMGRRAEKPSQI